MWHCSAGPQPIGADFLRTTSRLAECNVYIATCADFLWIDMTGGDLSYFMGFLCL